MVNHPQLSKLILKGGVKFAEYFAGKRAICRAHWREGVQAIPFEIDDDNIWGNILTAQGFAMCILLILCGDDCWRII
eukprot:8661824-Karenia_brevis.AAC.1